MKKKKAKKGKKARIDKTKKTKSRKLFKKEKVNLKQLFAFRKPKKITLKARGSTAGYRQCSACGLRYSDILVRCPVCSGKPKQ